MSRFAVEKANMKKKQKISSSSSSTVAAAAEEHTDVSFNDDSFCLSHLSILMMFSPQQIPMLLPPQTSIIQSLPRLHLLWQNATNKRRGLPDRQRPLPASWVYPALIMWILFGDLAMKIIYIDMNYLSKAKTKKIVVTLNDFIICHSFTNKK